MDRPVTGPKRALVECALAMLALGATLRETQAATGFALKTLYRLDAHRRRRGPNLTADEQRNIERLLRRGRLTQRAIARRSKRALGTVNNVARRAELRSGRKRFKQLRRPRKCPKHGLVKLWPCVACEAGLRREA